MKDLMLDLETWGLRPGCAIRSIGAVMFDPRSDAIGEKFYVNVEDQSCLILGLTQLQSTRDWWNGPKVTQKARDAFLVNPLPIAGAIGKFSAFFREQGAQRVWSQGANYDEPIMQAVYDLLGTKAPWKFWDSRCTRTAYGLAGLNFNAVSRAGTAHDALDDAMHQVKCVQRAFRMLDVKGRD